MKCEDVPDEIKDIVLIPDDRSVEERVREVVCNTVKEKMLLYDKDVVMSLQNAITGNNPNEHAMNESSYIIWR